MLNHVTSPSPREDAEDRGGDQGQVCCMGQALNSGPSRERRGEGRMSSLGQVGGTVVWVCGAAVGIGVDGFHARVLLDLSDECCRRILKLLHKVEMPWICPTNAWTTLFCLS